MIKILKLLGLSLCIIIVSTGFYIKFALPNVSPPEDILVDITQEKIARGKYLANYVCVCTDCHSTRDWSRFSGPIEEGTLGMGGQEFDQSMGFPGRFYSKNITPANLNKWTDGEILRAIASGVSRDGKSLFPVMPHGSYGKMDREDLYAIIAYLRSLIPIENEVPPAEPDFPMSILINTIPKSATFTTIPDQHDLIDYGAYLFNAAVCADCHTRQERGKPIKGMELAGGFEFPMAGGITRSANITPDIETGIGSWSETDFIEKFKSFNEPYDPGQVETGEFNTIMPWTMYSKMTEYDLKAIYNYLRTQPPIKNAVVKFSKK